MQFGLHRFTVHDTMFLVENRECGWHCVSRLEISTRITRNIIITIIVIIIV